MPAERKATVERRGRNIDRTRPRPALAPGRTTAARIGACAPIAGGRRLLSCLGRPHTPHFLTTQRSREGEMTTIGTEWRHGSSESGAVWFERDRGDGVVERRYTVPQPTRDAAVLGTARVDYGPSHP